MADIKNKVYKRSQLWSNSKGRDYIKIEDEIYSINGLYCDKDGNQDRWGQFVVVIDVRWPVLTHRQYDGKLSWMGDMHDLCALEHWGYKWTEQNNGPEEYKRVPNFETEYEVPSGK